MLKVYQVNIRLSARNYFKMSHTTLSTLKEPLLEAIERFDESWKRRDELAFKAVVSEINRLLIEACREIK
jgi:hypothetical protein